MSDRAARQAMMDFRFLIVDCGWVQPRCLIAVEAEEVGDFKPGGVVAAFDVVEVDLGDGESGVAEEAGDGFEVVAGFFAEHGGGVAQGVDGDVGGVEAGQARIFFY